MNKPYCPTYTSALFRLTMVMEDRRLPTPYRIGWDNTEAHGFRLLVQPDGADYRPWLEALGDDKVVRADKVGKEVHVHAWGTLHDAPQVPVHLVGVVAPDAVTEAVGS